MMPSRQPLASERRKRVRNRPLDTRSAARHARVVLLATCSLQVRNRMTRVNVDRGGALRVWYLVSEAVYLQLLLRDGLRWERAAS